MKVTWTKASRFDLGLIKAYYQGRNPAAAKRMVADIRHAASILERYPEAGREAELKGCRLLQIAGRPFMLPYRIVNDEIQILAVFDARRQRPAEWQ